LISLKIFTTISTVLGSILAGIDSTVAHDLTYVGKRVSGEELAQTQLRSRTNNLNILLEIDPKGFCWKIELVGRY